MTSMIGKQIGHGLRALAGDEREAAAAVARRLDEQTGIAAGLRRTHAAVLARQRKLVALEEHLLQQGATLIGRSRQRRPLGAWSAPA